MLVGGVVHHQVGDDADAAAVGRVEEALEVLQRAVVGVDRRSSRRCRSRRRAAARGRTAAARGSRPPGPAGSRASGQAGEVADAVAVGVLEGADVQLVDDRVLVPERSSTVMARAAEAVGSCIA